MTSIIDNSGSLEPNDLYKVGPKKPPLHSKFQNGNRLGKGRPKGAKNIKTVTLEALDAKVEAKVDGKLKKISKMELAMRHLANKGASGDLKAISKMIDLHERYGSQEDKTGPAPAEIKADLDTLRDYLNFKDWTSGSGGDSADA